MEASTNLHGFDEGGLESHTMCKTAPLANPHRSSAHLYVRAACLRYINSDVAYLSTNVDRSPRVVRGDGVGLESHGHPECRG